ncbi:MAG: ComEA family DNA-binding protein [Schwartzia sp.]|nr:ComEA family DNA-binding protein [Schwartzia sp. (in: firmicutes)]
MPMFRRPMLVLAAVALAVLFVGVMMFRETEEAVPLDAGVRPAEEQQITVYVSGAVVKPGVVAMRKTERVEQAIAVCGGALPQADIANVNLAQPLKDGMQIRVPERPDAGGSAPAAARTDGKIHINTAGEKELDELPGVGPIMAKRIVEYRNEHGPFESVDDLAKVRGIGAEKLAKIREKAEL